MLSMFFSYYSELLDDERDLKVEINFIDNIQYPSRKCGLETYLGDLDLGDLEFLYPNKIMEYTTEIEMDCYSPEEIFVDKVRASLTRRAYKMRDVIDIYILEKKFGFIIDDFNEVIISKINFMANLYERYRENLKIKDFPDIDILKEEEMKLMISEPPKDLGIEVKRIHDELSVLKDRVTSSLNL